MGLIFLIAFLAFLVLSVFESLGLKKNGDFKVNFSPARGAPYGVLALVFLFLMLSFVQVGSGSVGVVARWGRATRQIGPGAHLIIPVAEAVWPVVVQTRIVKPNASAGSHDLQVVHMEVTLAYHLDPMYGVFNFVTLNNDAEVRIIIPAILDGMKAICARYDAQALLTSRPLVRDGIEDFVKARLLPYHIIADVTSVTDLDFSPEFNAAIEAKVVAQQKAEEALNDLARIKTEAQQQIEAAKGEAEALRSQKEQITPELLQLRTIEMLTAKWDGHFPTTMVGSNGAIPMLDVLKGAGK